MQGVRLMHYGKMTFVRGIGGRFLKKKESHVETLLSMTPRNLTGTKGQSRYTLVSVKGMT